MTDRVETRFLRAQKAAKQRLKEELTQKKEALELYPTPYISMSGLFESREPDAELAIYADEILFTDEKETN